MFSGTAFPRIPFVSESNSSGAHETALPETKPPAIPFDALILAADAARESESLPTDVARDAATIARFEDVAPRARRRREDAVDASQARRPSPSSTP